MTIEIDDAGTGDLIGDAFIGFLREETGEIIFRTIPVKFFNEENWKKRLVYNLVVELVKDGLKELNFDKETEKIRICRGNIFDRVITYFDEEEIKYERTSIEGVLQDAVEGRLVSHLRKLGVRSRNLTKKSGAKRYFVLLNWLCQDFYNREKFVKSGFKKWIIMNRDLAIQKYERIKREKSKKQKGYS